MCQILCLTAHDPSKLKETIQRVWRQMANTQKDGYGAAWFGANGEIGFLKRRYPNIIGSEHIPFVQAKGKATDPFEESNDIPSDGGFLIIHGRSATNTINLANTHPFIDELDDGRRVAMVHNGSVKSSKYSNLLEGCTCDSELLLRAYTDGGISTVDKYIDGRYAFMYIEYVPPTQEQIDAATPENPAVGKKTLHIAKDAGTFLYCGLQSDKTFCIATSEYLFPKVDAELEGELNSNIVIVFEDRLKFTLSEFKPLTWTEKRAAGFLDDPNAKKDKIKQEQTHQNHHHQTYPSTSNKDLSLLDSKIEEAEKAEIEALEQEAIETL